MANPKESGIAAECRPRISKTRLVFRVGGAVVGVGGMVAASAGFYDTYHNIRPEISALQRQVDLEYPKPSRDTLDVSLDQVAQFRINTNTALENHDYDKYWQLAASQEDAQKVAQDVIKQDDINQQQFSIALDNSGLGGRDTKDFIVTFGGLYATAIGLATGVSSIILPRRETKSKEQLIPRTT